MLSKPATKSADTQEAGDDYGAGSVWGIEYWLHCWKRPFKDYFEAALIIRFED